MKAKTLKISLLMVLGVFVSMSMFAQPANFQEHGNNSSGNPDPSEAIDSITVGASIRYVVEPDSDVNPGYDFATMSGTLSSSFEWTVDTEVGTISSSPDTINDITITAAADTTAGTGHQIQVVETSSAGCESGTTRTIEVKVIALPTSDFTSTSDGVCTADPATVAYDFPVSLSTSEANGYMRVILSVDGPVTAGLYSNTYDVLESATTLNIAAGNLDDGYGDYTVTITQVSDRISRKSGRTDDGVITTGTFTLTINKTPVTGPIYHLPNQ